MVAAFTFVVGERRTEILGHGPHTFGTNLDKAEAFEHRCRLSERILDGAQQGTQFVPTAMETASRNQEPSIQRCMIRPASRAASERSL
ncbi:MAG: hypothetical protein J7463_04840 [Roseiflexus sp.]|jgi:hypothetical protein|nr:hypothetical protein [Roseiflexus sp.]MBO9334588.1 hypothetical protein [Roseiflexus sp.]MBO9341556.1 hypothetical protein [Roseiflexus sp.]MBO9364970.1 hypothetical protein [Roseiflexus sp.]MBO9382645.1 hypothetical protein [Roseiflexus sp.]